MCHRAGPGRNGSSGRHELVDGGDIDLALADPSAEQPTDPVGIGVPFQHTGRGQAGSG